MKDVYCNELLYMINAAEYLSMCYEKQYNEMEWFARWDLAEEIGMEWIDAKEIIYSKNLTQAISDESSQLLKKILLNFEQAFEKTTESNVWTFEAMINHPFWKEQRELAVAFLKEIKSKFCV